MMRDAPLGGIWLLGLTMSLVAGCHSGPSVDARDVQPLHYAEGQPRSLAFASPQQREALAQANLPPGEPWFASRNDHRPSVAAGAQSETFERSVTITIDRQRASRGRVYDDYRETTYRERIQESWR